MKLLALDLSTKTGIAVFEGQSLKHHGLIKHTVVNYKADIKSSKDLPSDYPYNFIRVGEAIADECILAYQTYGCDTVVIEHTEKGKQRLSQRLLEWINLVVVQKFAAIGVEVHYLLVNEWRNLVKCYLKYWPEYRVWNSKINRLKKQAIPTKSGARVAKENGKIVTKVDLKKLSIKLANEHYGLELKDDNIADAVNLGRAFLMLKPSPE